MTPMPNTMIYTATKSIRIPVLRPIPTLLPCVAWLLSTLALHMGHCARIFITGIADKIRNIAAFLIIWFCTAKLWIN